MSSVKNKERCFSSCHERGSLLTVESVWLRPSSDAVLQPSRIKYNELSSYEVQRLNQFGTAYLIQIGSVN